MKDAMTLPVKIGAFEATFHLYETTASDRYDNGGTFTLYSYTDEGCTTRLVMIPANHVQYQTARYSSGLGAPRPYYDDHDDDGPFFGGITPGVIVDRLLARLAQPRAEE